MNLKRILTSLIGFPLVVLLVAVGTPQIINFAIMLIAMICMNEYFNAISNGYENDVYKKLYYRYE